MPMLFCLAIHNALAAVKIHLVDGEHLFAFLDDIYVLCSPERIAGIQWHEGKTRVWNRARVCPSIWVRKFGVLQAPRYWALLLAHLSSSAI